MTPAQLERWARDYRRKLDHRIKLDQIRRDGSANVQQIREGWSGLRRKEEALSLRLLEDRVRWASADARQGRKGFPIELAQRWHDTRLELTNTTPPDEVALLPLWQRDIEQCARVLGVSIEWTATPMNAYSFGRGKRIEISKIVTATSYAKARHELGHQARPCQPTHRPVTTDAKLKRSVCVACELGAWQWAIDGACPQWTRRMHDCFSRSLRSYHRYGTPSEQRAIDDMASGLGFRHAQLAQARTP